MLLERLPVTERDKGLCCQILLRDLPDVTKFSEQIREYFVLTLRFKFNKAVRGLGEHQLLFNAYFLKLFLPENSWQNQHKFDHFYYFLICRFCKKSITWKIHLNYPWFWRWEVSYHPSLVIPHVCSLTGDHLPTHKTTAICNNQNTKKKPTQGKRQQGRWKFRINSVSALIAFFADRNASLFSFKALHETKAAAWSHCAT